MNVVLVVILVLVLFGGGFGLHPSITNNYGYWPSGGLGLVFLVLLILALTGRL